MPVNGSTDGSADGTAHAGSPKARTDVRRAASGQDRLRDAETRPDLVVGPDEAAAVLAHELRGPLAVVTGYLDLLGRARDQETRDFALGAAQRAVTRMDIIIDDVLDSLGSSRGSREPCAPIDPASVARSLLADVPSYRARVSFANSCTMLARADAVRLERALSNVVDNALKFSPADATVRVALVDAGSRVSFVVEDDGPGLPPGETHRLRGAFERLDRDSAIPGYGIGLGVTVELIESMGGEVVLGNREDGHGARVELMLPGVPVAGENWTRS